MGGEPGARVKNDETMMKNARCLHLETPWRNKTSPLQLSGQDLCLLSPLE